MSRKARWASPEEWAEWMGADPDPITAQFTQGDFFHSVRNRWGPEFDGPRAIAMWDIFGYARAARNAPTKPKK